MARRRKIFKFSIKRDSLVSVLATLLILFGCLTLVSFFAQGASVSFFIQEVINWLFGWGSFLVPLIFLVAGLNFIRHRPKFITFSSLLGLVISAFAFVSLTHLLFFRGESSYNQAQLGQGGGLIGYFSSRVLIKSFSTVGAFLVLSAALVIGNLILFNTSIDVFFGYSIKILARFKFLFQRSLRFFSLREEKFISATPPRVSINGWGGSSPSAPAEEQKVPLINGGGSRVEVVPRPVEPAPVRPLSQESFPEPENKEFPNEDRAIKEETVKNESFSQIWEYPPLGLLSETKVVEANRGDVAKSAATIERTLESFGIKARVVEINLGPSVTQYALESAQGTKIAKIKNLQNDLALSLASPTGTVRIEAPIPGKSLVGVEVPNLSPSLVTLKTVMEGSPMRTSKSKLAVVLGLDVAGNPLITDIRRMPHLLIAGSTGSGKSTLIHSFMASFLFRCSPDEIRFILVDTKRVELTEYNDIPHLLTPVITEPEKVLSALKWAIGEMDRRYKLFQSAKVRDIDSYNELSGFQALPYIVILVDEMADMMQLAPVEVEKSVCRLAQLARATGVHLVLATQRPSVDVLTGLIKANIPCRIAFNVTSLVDSRVIIDQPGAEKLLGRGDMLYLPSDSSKPVRIQGVYVTSAELHALIDFIRSKNIVPSYEEVTQELPVASAGTGSEDELFGEAVKIICEYDRASASLLQRRLKVGYARAARLLDEMEAQGIVSSADGSRPREVLIHDPSLVLGGDE